MEFRENQVSVCRAAAESYPSTPPFHPSQRFPEYQFGKVHSHSNVVYDAVRSCFHTAGLDGEHYGTTTWNPLGNFIHPGETVMLKPNLVKEYHPRDPRGWQYILTHGSIVRAVADYVWKALEGRGKIVVADGPQTDSSFDRIVDVLGLEVIRDFYNGQGLLFDVLDLRQEQWTCRDQVITDRRRLLGDPNGYIAFDLGQYSEFMGHFGAGAYYGADYDAGEVNRHHRGGRHEYLVASSAIHCDVMFSLPKLKTHKKAGVTLSLKNLVGINGDRNWLPHHTEGDPSNGGDEHPFPDIAHKAERALVPYFRQVSLRLPGVGPWLYRQVRGVGRRMFGDSEEVVRSGNWWGNDTVWRMCLDLNKLVLYGQPDGSLRSGIPQNRKRHFVLVDGIIGGEGRGPMNPDPVFAGVVLFGLNAPTVDATCASLMGYDPERIPTVREAFRCKYLPLAEWSWHDVQVTSNKPEWNGPAVSIPDHTTYHFKPHFGWKNHIERTTRVQEDNDGSRGVLSEAASSTTERRL